MQLCVAAAVRVWVKVSWHVDPSEESDDRNHDLVAVVVAVVVRLVVVVAVRAVRSDHRVSAVPGWGHFGS